MGIFRCQKVRNCSKYVKKAGGRGGETCERDRGTNLKKLPMSKARTIRAIKQTIVVGYNPKNKINTHK